MPLWGMKGLSLESRKSNSLDTTITIELNRGSNKIELAVTNLEGSESFRSPLVVNYSPKERPLERVYFTGIGIDRFANSQYNLRYSTKDIRDLVLKLLFSPSCPCFL